MSSVEQQPGREQGYAEDKDELLNRLRRIKGQVGGIEKMVESDRYCIDIVTQITAARAALDQVALRLLEEHTRHCVMEAEGQEQAERAEELMAVVGRLVGARR